MDDLIKTEHNEYLKIILDLDQSSMLITALTKNLFTRPRNEELLYEINNDSTYSLYVEISYFEILRAQFKQANDSGKFARTSMADKWYGLKKSIDSCESAEIDNSMTLMPLLSTLIENVKPITRSLFFDCNKVSIMKDPLDFLPKIIDKDYKLQVDLQETRTNIWITDLTAKKTSLIGGLENSSVGNGGMLLNNKEYRVTLEWQDGSMAKIFQIGVYSKESQATTIYYIHMIP